MSNTPAQGQARKRAPRRQDWMPNRMFDPVNNPFAIQNLLEREKNKEDVAFLPDADGRPEFNYAGNSLLRDTEILPPKNFHGNRLLDEPIARDHQFYAEYEESADDEFIDPSAEDDESRLETAQSEAAQPEAEVQSGSQLDSQPDSQPGSQLDSDAHRESMLAGEAVQAQAEASSPELAEDAPTELIADAAIDAQAALQAEPPNNLANSQTDTETGTEADPHATEAAETAEAVLNAADQPSSEDEAAIVAAEGLVEEPTVDADTAHAVQAEAHHQEEGAGATETSAAANAEASVEAEAVESAATEIAEQGTASAEAAEHAAEVAESATDFTELAEAIADKNTDKDTENPAELMASADAGEISADAPADVHAESQHQAEPPAESATPAELDLNSEAVLQLVQAAREEARAEAYEQGRRDAHEAAYQEGLEAGITQTKAELQQQYDDKVAQVNDLIAGLQSLGKDPDALFEPLKKLSVHLAEQLVRGELTQSPQTISRLVDNCLRELAASGEKAVIIHLNPEDLEQYRPMVAQFGDSIVLRPDALLARGSVRASLDGSVVEDLIDRRVKGVRKSLAQPMANTWQPAATNPLSQRSLPVPPRAVVQPPVASEDASDELTEEATHDVAGAADDAATDVLASGDVGNDTAQVESAAGDDVRTPTEDSPLS